MPQKFQHHTPQTQLPLFRSNAEIRAFVLSAPIGVCKASSIRKVPSSRELADRRKLYYGVH